MSYTRDMVARRVVYGVVALVVVGALVWYVRTPPPPRYESVQVGEGSVVHVVSATGHAEPVERLELTFPEGGRLVALAVREGDIVPAGAELAQLESKETSLLREEAEARAASAAAAYEGLLTHRPEDVAAHAGALAAAERAVAVARQSAETAVSRAWTLADGALHRDAAPFFAEPDTAFGITYEYGTTRYVVQSRDHGEELREGYAAAEAALSRIAAVSTPADQTSMRAVAADLVTIDTFLGALAAAVNRYTPSGSEEGTVYDTFQSGIARARSGVSTARSDVASASGALENAEAHAAAERAAYELAVAPPTSSAERGAAADTRAASLAAAAAAAREEDAVLRAPFTGMISRIDRTLGESVAPYAPVLELLTPGAFEVELYIPEADIAEVKVGDRATLTFDAFDRSEVFTGSVARIARSETVREGVPTYKTTLALDHASYDRTVLPGMTADVDITTSERQNVLTVPARSVLVTGGRTYVRVVVGGSLVERDVVTGLHGSDGSVEVVSGLTEGEEVVLFVEE